MPCHIARVVREPEDHTDIRDALRTVCARSTSPKVKNFDGTNSKTTTRTDKSRHGEEKNREVFTLIEVFH